MTFDSINPSVENIEIYKDILKFVKAASYSPYMNIAHVKQDLEGFGIEAIFQSALKNKHSIDLYLNKKNIQAKDSAEIIHFALEWLSGITYSEALKIPLYLS